MALDGIRAKLERVRYAKLLSRVVSTRNAGRLIGEAIDAPSPKLVGRLGSVEALCLGVAKYGHGMFPDYVAEAMANNAGFFPNNTESLERFCEIYQDALAEVDVLGLWQSKFQYRIVSELLPQPQLVDLPGLEPYLNDAPWSANLADKKVLVVHPFAASIASQYEKNRAELFSDSRVLPLFDLSVLQAPLTLAGNQSSFPTWFDAFDWLKAQADRVDYDIALIGCGAYGLPLGAHIKSQGKKAIQLGGATQILFGIRGKRWDGIFDFQKMFNEYWCYPSEDERPQNLARVEGGCYW